MYSINITNYNKLLIAALASNLFFLTRARIIAAQISTGIVVNKPNNPKDKIHKSSDQFSNILIFWSIMTYYYKRLYKYTDP